MENISLIFKEKKLKLTPQRLAVYQYLKSTTEHPSAETIYNGLQATYPTMSLETVYKSLKTLVDVNLVQELNLGEGNFRYDYDKEFNTFFNLEKIVENSAKDLKISVDLNEIEKRVNLTKQNFKYN